MTPDDNHDETAGAGARAQPRAAAAVPEAASSNTASGKYTGVIDRLRQGIDSLYLSYRGVIYSGVEEELKALKTLAQHPKRHEQSRAQYAVGNHVFEVTSKGGPGFPFTLRDNAFVIKVSTSKNGEYPLAYVQISSRYLSAVTPQAAEAELQSIVDVLGEVEGTPTVSRADLFVDFLSRLPVDFRHPEVWITRAREKRPFYENDKLTGWIVGPGGRINCRLYDKTIEIKQSKKDYLKELWAQEGYFSGDTVWRLEYELQRAFLAQMGIKGLPQLLASLGSLWRYATRKWLRLTEPSEDKNRSRWPTHPLWEALSGIEWDGNQPVMLSRYSHRRVPGDAYFHNQHFGLVTAYMAREGIATYEEACRQLASRTRSFHEGHCFTFIGVPFEQLVDERVAFKARQYNTRLNASPRRSDADDYRRQSDGE